MFWLKFIVMVVILVTVLALGVEFSVLHDQQVTINYLLGSTTQPLALVTISAFAFGVLLALLIVSFIIVPLRWRVARLQQATTAKDEEIRLLTKRLERGAT